ncbi:DUF2946 domain-containing protein [Stutzerimonas kirkiae]|nr:DUF2946 domain-containing protein [Stutzerimonas kirkiae]TBV13451.1 DUF2946 domain-containing protein [Stutzerimonas kirkiae]
MSRLQVSRHSKGLAWLGLCAMLLIYTGPLLSQMQQAGHAEHHAAAGHHHAGHGHHTPERYTLASALDACGYCTLLLSSPALGSSRPCLPTCPIHGRTLPPAPYRIISTTAPFPRALPRAPPAAS